MRRTLLAFGLALFCTGAFESAAAPINDPQGVLDNFIAGVPVTSEDSFTFMANVNGGGVYNFENASPNTWSALEFFVTLPNNSLIACGPGPIFRTCSVQVVSTTGPNSVYEMAFNAPQNGIGITPTSIFGLDLNDDINGQPNFSQSGSGGWGPNNMFNVTTVLAMPEPADAGLLGAGLFALGLIARRNRRKT